MIWETIRNTIFSTSKYERQTQIEKAYFIYTVLVFAFVLGTFYFLFIPDAEGTSQTGETLTHIQDIMQGGAISILTVSIFYGVTIISYFLTRSGYVNLGGVGVFIIIYSVAIVPILLGTRNTAQTTVPAIFSLLILLGGLLYQTRGAMVATIICLLTMWLNFDPNLVSRVYIISITLLGFTGVLAAYIRLSDVNRNEGVRIEQAERLTLAEVTTKLSSLSLNRSDLDTVLKQGLDTIREGYPQFYHAQVFLVDEAGRNAQLVSSTGDAGRALLQRQHSIGVGTQSVIGQATLRNTHIISRSGGQSVHQRNEFLPDTIVEAAFPLRVGTQVIGTLDLQSKQNLELSDNEISIYQSMANSFALAIDNVRQFEVSEARIEENQRLATQAQQALQEVDRLNKRLMEQAWSEYLASQNEQLGVNVDFENNVVEASETWSDTLSQALADGDVVQSVADDQRLIAIPLKVRGQVVGAMEFEMDADGNIDPNDLSLIQEVSERFGLAAENTRLVEESQRVAQREALINEVGSRLQSTNNIESTLTEAVRSLNNILGAQRVSIKLHEPSDQFSNGTS